MPLHLFLFVCLKQHCSKVYERYDYPSGLFISQKCDFSLIHRVDLKTISLHRDILFATIIQR